MKVKDYKETGITTKFLGTRVMIDKATGREEVFEEIQKTVSHSLPRGWRRVYLENFFEILSSLYTQARKLDVVEFILENLNSENQLCLTQMQVVKKSGIAKQTVTDTYKHLVKCDFMKKVGSVYVVNPKFVCAFGSDKKNANILLKIKQEEEQTLPQFEASSPETA